jgi:hypothetical protein
MRAGPIYRDTEQPAPSTVQSVTHFPLATVDGALSAKRENSPIGQPAQWASAHADVLRFSAITDTGEIASFKLDGIDFPD